jgi:hypothetical protein
MRANRSIAGGYQRRRVPGGITKATIGGFGAILLGVCISLSACVLVNSSSIGEKTGGGTPVSAEYSDYGILHLTAPWTLTANANSALAGQCQTGMLSNVQTELATRDWFFIVQYYTVTLNAVCK